MESFERDKSVRFGRSTGYPSTKLLVFDFPVNEDLSSFSRRIGNTTLYLKNNKVIKFENTIKLPVIRHTDLSNNKLIRNPLIGSFDIETYFDSDLNKSFTYAVGFKAGKEKAVLYYNKEKQSSNELILECINNMLKYDNYTFYCVRNAGWILKVPQRKPTI
jgi:hypothetical protein